MSVDCKWIEHNLEALFSGTLTQQDEQRARHHIENCGPCGREIAALNSIDPLIKRYFDRELRMVQQGSIRRVTKGRIVSLTAGALIAASLLLVTVSRISRPNATLPQTVPAQSVASDNPGSEAPPVERITEATATDLARTKPVDGVQSGILQTPRGIPATGNNAPEFLVIDLAGYARTLDDYRGHVLVLGILNSGHDTAANLERAYRLFEANPKFRFLGVMNERAPKPANTTFPVAYNQGSKLFEAAPGDFVLLNETGSVQLRGSLVKDFNKLQKALQDN